MGHRFGTADLSHLPSHLDTPGMSPMLHSWEGALLGACACQTLGAVLPLFPAAVGGPGPFSPWPVPATANLFPVAHSWQ